MNKKSKLFAAFGLGALVGAALVALYSTEEGKALVKKAKDQLGDLANDFKTTMENFQEELAGFVKKDTNQDNSQA